MKSSKTKSMAAKELAAARQSDMRRMMFMGVLLLLLAVAFGATKCQESKHRALEGESEAPELAAPAQEILIVPKLDSSQLGGLVADSSPTDRGVLEDEAVDVLGDYVRRLTDAHYEKLGVTELDSELTATIAGEPGAHRGEALRARGHLDFIRDQQRGTERPSEHVGMLMLEDGSQMFFLVHDLPDLVALRPYMRVDGLFLKMYREETPDGWMEGPLIVGARAVRSYPDIGAVSELSPELFGSVADDTAQQVSQIPFLPRWTLMAYARDLPGDAIDWAQAPELDNTALVDLLKNGSSHRGAPFRIPISTNMGSWVEDAGENPARLDSVTTGWIGNQYWTTGAIKYVSPFHLPEIQDTRLITARGFFLKNHAYQPRDGGLAVAPYFIMQAVEPYIPPPEPYVNLILWVVAGITIGMIALFLVLLVRDQRKTQALQAELLRRRRERRTREVREAPSES